MTQRLRALLIFCILLIPSAQLAWRNRQMPQFAYLHDDGVLFVTAKSIAADSNRIASLPEEPFQTKFPPLYPLYLSLVWRMNPNFPDNLRLATLFAWMPLAVYVGLVWLYYRKAGLSEGRTWLLVALIAANPYIIWFGGMLFSDVFFACWLVATLLVARRQGVAMAAAAGVLAGCAYLARTAGIALLVSVPLVMLWRRESRRAAAFAAAMLPAILGWALWTRAHVLHSNDLTVIYYTDYVRFVLHNTLRDVPVILWKNVDQLLYAMGSMILPRIFDPLPVKILTQVIAVAMIKGTVKLARRGINTDYAAFALVSVAILTVCNFPSTERYMVPLYPVLVAGFVVEVEDLGRMLRAAFHHQDRAQRVVAAGFSGIVIAVIAAAVWLQLYMGFVFLPQSAALKFSALRDRRAAYAWIATNLPASATVLSYDDPLLYLYTGRRGNHMPLDPLFWYREDHASIQAAYRELAAYCRRRGLQYVYFTSEDLSRETGEEDGQAVRRIVRANPELTPLYSAGIGTVYKVGLGGQ